MKAVPARTAITRTLSRKRVVSSPSRKGPRSRDGKREVHFGEVAERLRDVLARPARLLERGLDPLAGKALGECVMNEGAKLFRCRCHVCLLLRVYNQPWKHDR